MSRSDPTFQPSASSSSSTQAALLSEEKKLREIAERRAEEAEHRAQEAERQLMELKRQLANFPIIPVVNQTGLFGAPVAAKKSEPPVDKKLLKKLLQHIAYGEQDEAEAMIKENPNLLFNKGTVTDYSNRTFDQITPLALACWGWDWHMWTMITHYLPEDAASQQLAELEANGTAHGKHYDFNDLLKPYKTCLDPCTSEQLAKPLDIMISGEQFAKHWDTVIGGAQSRVPAGVAQVVCQKDVPLHPTPDFKNPVLKRTLKMMLPEASFGEYNLDNGSWFPLIANSCGLLGVDFAVLRSDFVMPSAAGLVGRLYPGGPVVAGYISLAAVVADFSALTELCKTRTEQYEELKAQLLQARNDSAPQPK